MSFFGPTRDAPLPGAEEQSAIPAGDAGRRGHFSQRILAWVRTHPRRAIACAIGCLVVGWIAYWAFVNRAEDPEEQVDELVASEEWILKITPHLKGLAHSVLNLRLPGAKSAALFADNVRVNGLRSPTERSSRVGAGISQTAWRLQHTAHESNRGQLKLWEPLFEHVAYFQHAKFYIWNARFTDEGRGEIETDLRFDALAADSDDKPIEVHAKQLVRWKRDADDVNQWRIVRWQQQQFSTATGERPLFTEVTRRVVPDPEEYVRARRNLHEELLVDLVAGRKLETPPYFAVYTDDRHPGLSVVDIDNDGWDDLYLMSRWGKNLLFRNRRDGTFEEIAGRLGLDIEDYCGCAVFADFDNDGDADCFLGRTLRRSMYLRNEKGQFVDRSQQLAALPLPYLVYSLAAADYNRDGLLDIYISTYAAHQIHATYSTPYTGVARPGQRPKGIQNFLPPQDVARLRQMSNQHGIRDREGPPNLLLVNRGGRFERAPENERVAAWRSTTQATWADYDNDGDPDLYLSNDYAPNNLYRNDGPAGFVDVTEETGTADVGFGMGVGWGDYDLDGRQDLYVSNMFSKAGRRITAQIDRLDTRFAQMARGNSLFHNKGGTFEKVSGLAPPAMLVEKAGWSWAGQFVDVNNDGFLDIHALNGFYTAPKEVAEQIDL